MSEQLILKDCLVDNNVDLRYLEKLTIQEKRWARILTYIISVCSASSILTLFGSIYLGVYVGWQVSQSILCMIGLILMVIGYSNRSTKALLLCSILFVVDFVILIIISKSIYTFYELSRADAIDDDDDDDDDDEDDDEEDDEEDHTNNGSSGNDSKTINQYQTKITKLSAEAAIASPEEINLNNENLFIQQINDNNNFFHAMPGEKTKLPLLSTENVQKTEGEGLRSGNKQLSVAVSSGITAAAVTQEITDFPLQEILLLVNNESKHHMTTIDENENLFKVNVVKIDDELNTYTNDPNNKKNYLPLFNVNKDPATPPPLEPTLPPKDPSWFEVSSLVTVCAVTHSLLSLVRIGVLFRLLFILRKYPSGITFQKAKKMIAGEDLFEEELNDSHSSVHIQERGDEGKFDVLSHSDLGNHNMFLLNNNGSNNNLLQVNSDVSSSIQPHLPPTLPLSTNNNCNNNIHPVHMVHCQPSDNFFPSPQPSSLLNNAVNQNCLATFDDLFDSSQYHSHVHDSSRNHPDDGVFRHSFRPSVPVSLIKFSNSSNLNNSHLSALGVSANDSIPPPPAAVSSPKLHRSSSSSFSSKDVTPPPSSPHAVRTPASSTHNTSRPPAPLKHAPSTAALNPPRLSAVSPSSSHPSQSFTAILRAVVAAHHHSAQAALYSHPNPSPNHPTFPSSPSIYDVTCPTPTEDLPDESSTHLLSPPRILPLPSSATSSVAESPFSSRRLLSSHTQRRRTTPPLSDRGGLPFELGMHDGVSHSTSHSAPRASLQTPPPNANSSRNNTHLQHFQQFTGSEETPPPAPLPSSTCARASRPLRVSTSVFSDEGSRMHKDVTCDQLIEGYHLSSNRIHANSNQSTFNPARMNLSELLNQKQELYASHFSTLNQSHAPPTSATNHMITSNPPLRVKNLPSVASHASLSHAASLSPCADGAIARTSSISFSSTATEMDAANCKIAHSPSDLIDLYTHEYIRNLDAIVAAGHMPIVTDNLEARSALGSLERLRNLYSQSNAINNNNNNHSNTCNSSILFHSGNSGNSQQQPQSLRTAIALGGNFSLSAYDTTKLQLSSEDFS